MHPSLSLFDPVKKEVGDLNISITTSALDDVKRHMQHSQQREPLGYQVLLLSCVLFMQLAYTTATFGALRIAA
eukprot:5038844-Amphidinium_carterae.1